MYQLKRFILSNKSYIDTIRINNLLEGKLRICHYWKFYNCGNLIKRYYLLRSAIILTLFDDRTIVLEKDHVQVVSSQHPTQIIYDKINLNENGIISITISKWKQPNQYIYIEN